MISSTVGCDTVLLRDMTHLKAEFLLRVQGKEAVPESVDHVIVSLDPREDRSWLQSNPTVPTDNAHALDKVGPSLTSKENWSEGIKRLKPRVLIRLIDTHKMEQVSQFQSTEHLSPE